MRGRWSSNVRRRVSGPLVFLAVASLAGCASQTVSSSGGLGATAGTGDSLMASVAPALAVERFLQAANVSDYATMGELFGTSEGPVDWPRVEIEQHMDLISRILQHEDYRLGQATRVPARPAQTMRVGVDLTIDGDVVPDVAFLVVLSEQSSWLVEEIDLQAVTNR